MVHKTLAGFGDRLTRSLADFAKLAEEFDEYGVSFVSVTQQFTTTTSMGRLMLNVLLSFAQFEREIAVSATRSPPRKRRACGWVGSVPLGYDWKDRTLVINQQPCNIKGNINNRGEQIYHVPGGRYYNQTQIASSRGERWFYTEDETKAAGWRRSLR
jgi:DNA invertase Pin-like site-specific DNA recombinase